MTWPQVANNALIVVGLIAALIFMYKLIVDTLDD